MTGRNGAVFAVPCKREPSTLLDVPDHDSAAITRAVARRGAQILIAQALYISVGSLAAGTWRWPQLWIYAAVSLAMVIAALDRLLEANTIDTELLSAAAAKGVERVRAASVVQALREAGVELG